MRCFRLCNRSSFGETIGEEVDGHMLCKQDPCRSSNKLHNNRKGAFGGRLRTREVMTVHLGEQDRYLHRSCSLQILALQDRVQTLLIRWVLLLQEFDWEIKDKKGNENSVADHLSHLHVPGAREIGDSFPNEHLLAISSLAPWFAHIINFIVI